VCLFWAFCVFQANDVKRIAEGEPCDRTAKKVKVSEFESPLPEVQKFLRDQVGITDEESIKATTESLNKCGGPPWDVEAIQQSFDAFQEPAEFVDFMREWTVVLSIPAPVATKMWEYFSHKKIVDQLASTKESTFAEIAARVQTEMAEAMRIARTAKPRCTFCEIPEITYICNDDRGRMSCTRCGETHTCSCGGLVTVRGQHRCEDCKRIARECECGTQIEQEGEDLCNKCLARYWDDCAGEKTLCTFCDLPQTEIKKDSYGRMSCTGCGNTDSCEGCGTTITVMGENCCDDCC
jgi:hypothetical protein